MLVFIRLSTRLEVEGNGALTGASSTLHSRCARFPNAVHSQFKVVLYTLTCRMKAPLLPDHCLFPLQSSSGAKTPRIPSLRPGESPFTGPSFLTASSEGCLPSRSRARCCRTANDSRPLLRDGGGRRERPAVLLQDGSVGPHPPRYCETTAIGTSSPPRYCGTAAVGTSDPPQLDPNPAAQL